jgi:hypothetical protein
MKKTISLIAGALLLATGTTAQVPQVLGIWELDLKSSVLPATFPHSRSTVPRRHLPRGVRRIDADGKTMTIDVVAIDPSGKETPIKMVFKRVAGK